LRLLGSGTVKKSLVRTFQVGHVWFHDYTRRFVGHLRSWLGNGSRKTWQILGLVLALE